MRSPARPATGWSGTPSRRSGRRLTRSNPSQRRAPRVACTVEVAADAEPLADLQWGNEMIDATVDGSYAVQPGDPQVLVGIIDTGIDSTHPDLDDNVNVALSRNFTTDIPLIDGPCKKEPDRSCSDPASVDEGGHGTHVAGTVAAELNGIGISGVAPEVTLVNLRAGQDSGFFFLFETLAAYTYAANNGIDVVNMSFFTDPWWMNCRNNPLDSPAEQEEQATVIDSSNAALDYAFSQGVTLVASAGNEHTDMDNPTYDAISPDYPPGSEKVRDNITNACLDHPDRGEPRALHQRARPQRAEIVLLELRDHGDRGLRSGW